MPRWLLLALLALALWGILELLVISARRWLRVAFRVSFGQATHAAAVGRPDAKPVIALVRCARCGQHVPRQSALQSAGSSAWTCAAECRDAGRSARPLSDRASA